MEEFVTIATFTYPTELTIIKGRLESEGIECYVKDEYVVQAYNFLSNAIGGIKLQVKSSDAERASAILHEAGYLKDEEPETSKFWKRVDGFTATIPLIKKFRTELRFIILIAIILVFLSVIAVLVFTPST